MPRSYSTTRANRNLTKDNVLSALEQGYSAIDPCTLSSFERGYRASELGPGSVIPPLTRTFLKRFENNCYSTQDTPPHTTTVSCFSLKNISFFRRHTRHSKSSFIMWVYLNERRGRKKLFKSSVSCVPCVPVPKNVQQEGFEVVE